MTKIEKRWMADELGEAEEGLQTAERYHRRQQTELSRRVLGEAKRRLTTITRTTLTIHIFRIIRSLRLKAQMMAQGRCGIEMMVL